MVITKKRATSASQASGSKSPAESMDIYEHIAALAYFKAQERGFCPGHEMDDWLEAEQEINGAASSGNKH